ncbi:hypothetical protein GYMLUDRAFT_711824 [Collybiopsis luxurians FD-317 M1]|nr:hypothetical protein GYMLUDRAFT_711824 [Collybiopsis luxurians FD-317 M1]
MIWTCLSRCRTYSCTNRILSSHLLSNGPRFIISFTRPVSRLSLENSKGDSIPGTTDAEEDEISGIEEGVGKILPTSSHLFKLILPLSRKSPDGSPIPIVLLLHPSQPLSHVGRLILASLPRHSGEGPSVSFRINASLSRQLEWSDSTDIGDFIRNAARATEFKIHIIPDPNDSDSKTRHEGAEKVISVRVPTFADRTRFLRRRLDAINGQLASMEELKRECDREARRGARRMAVGGFGLLVVYWAAVARLTFWDYGWDVMEPITYLSGLSTVICGYLWFLYQGREVSYSSVLDRSVSARREALYKQRGLDIDKWVELGSERKHLMKEIGQIREDYEQPQGEKGHDKEADDPDDEDVEATEAKSPIHEPEEERTKSEHKSS